MVPVTQFRNGFGVRVLRRRERVRDRSGPFQRERRAARDRDGLARETGRRDIGRPRTRLNGDPRERP